MTFGVVGWQEARMAAPGSVGAKAATLARLAHEGLPVPEFFVVPAAGLSLHLAANGISWPASTEQNGERLAALANELRAAPVPPTMSGAVLDAYDRLCLTGGHPSVAVRSSGAEEDAAAASFAGQFASVLGVQGHEALLDALKECWASYLSPRSLAYRAQQGIRLGDEPRFAVIVQAQVFSSRAGVLFTVHPLEPNGDEACIEANVGTGDSVVGGLATPDTLTLSRSSGGVVDEHIGPKGRSAVLTDAEAREVLELGLRIERLLRVPQDVEWAYDSQRLWILQARPITALSPKGA